VRLWPRVEILRAFVLSELRRILLIGQNRVAMLKSVNSGEGLVAKERGWSTILRLVRKREYVEKLARMKLRERRELLSSSLIET
jgi:hypothetical protein